MAASSSTQPAARAGITLGRSRARRDQLLACAAGVVLLGVTILMQQPMQAMRAGIVTEPKKSLRGLAIQFPRLTLGGFRGLIATVLWIQAENDKNDHKWVELETKYEIIGTLQPYFVSVYIYHSWNEAYNLSAQWHSIDSKYKWVLDGLAYLYQGEEFNPNNPDLLLELGHLYFLKLGGSFERVFYRAHWRNDIARLHELNDKLAGKAKEDHRTLALAHVRDFVLRPQFHSKEMSNPSGKGGDGWGIQITDKELFRYRADGKRADEPMTFQYGLSPYYFAYIEYKRCLAAGNPTTTGINVIDAWPAMSLRLWCRDDLCYCQQTAVDLFANPAESPSPEEFNNKILEVRDCYRNVQMIVPRALEEFDQHLGRFPYNESIHRKHINETIAMKSIGQAESQLFEALVRWQLDGRKLTPEATRKFADALPLFEEALRMTTKWVDAMYMPPDPNRADYEKYMNALKSRITGIQNILKAQPGEALDMSFLTPEAVEK